MIKINYFVGSNNHTHELEKDKILQIFSIHYEGLTALEVTGYWQGKPEKTLQVSIITDILSQRKINKICRQLNTALNQQAIMVEILESNTQFISSR